MGITAGIPLIPEEEISFARERGGQRWEKKKGSGTTVDKKCAKEIAEIKEIFRKKIILGKNQFLLGRS